MARAKEPTERQRNASKNLLALRESLCMSRRAFAAVVGLDQEKVRKRELGLAIWKDYQVAAIHSHFRGWLREVRLAVTLTLAHVFDPSPEEAAGANILGLPGSCLSAEVVREPGRPGAPARTQAPGATEGED